MLLASCTSQLAPQLAAPQAPIALANSPATATPPMATVVAASPDPEPLPVSSPEPPARAAAEPRVLLEPVYSALGHPRLATEMQTLGRDEELFQWALGGSSDPAHPSNRPGYHPATRVVVDVELLSRAPKGSTKRLLRLARSNGYWPLRGCFEDAQRLNSKPERAAKVRLTLGAAGKVLGARSMGQTPERDYARCVVERLKALDFTPGFTRKLDVEISVKQWPGHAPVPPRAPKDSPIPRLDGAANAALQGLTPALVACYEPALERDPKLWGRVALRLELGPEGNVESAVSVETQFPDPEVTECARRAVVGARIPAAPLKELSLAVRFGQSAAPAAPATPGTPPSEDGTPPPPLAPPAPPTPGAPPSEGAPPSPSHSLSSSVEPSAASPKHRP